MYFARQNNTTTIRVVREVDQAGLAMAMSDDITTGERSSVDQNLLTEALAKMEEKLARCTTGGVDIHKQVLFGRPGFMIRNYAADCQADLLAVNSPDNSYGLLDRIFTHDMEYILESLPCNMLIVHSRHNTPG